MTNALTGSWTNERAWSKLVDLRMQAVACGNASYAALLTTVIDRIEASL